MSDQTRQGQRVRQRNRCAAFAQLVKRLVVVMSIPTDELRRALMAQGGNSALIAGG
jgi:hypothetical protein